MLDGACVAVVVPAYNEHRLVAQVIASMPSFVDHIVVVDDASTDDTFHVASGCPDRRVRVIRHADNRGVGASITTGYSMARAAGGDVIAVMAGDNQMHPDDLLPLLRPILTGQADYAKGDRLHHPDVGKCMPWTRRIGSMVLSHLTRIALKMPALSDSQCGFTAISGRAVDELPIEKLWPRYGYPNDLLGMLRERGLIVVDVMVRPVYASEKSGLRFYHVPKIIHIIARAGLRLRKRA